MKRIVFILMLATLVLSTVAGAKETKQMKGIVSQIRRAQIDINSIMATPDKAIPRDLLNKALCIGIIPSEVKFAFIFGGSYGRGLLVCRKNGTGDWGGPAFFTLGGGSFGFQIGGADTSVVFLVMNPAGARRMASSNVKLGADASVAAGPIGREVGAATTQYMNAEILTYSRSRGVFAGISLSGALVKQDLSDDHAVYGPNVMPRDILIRQNVRVGPVSRSLDHTLDKYSSHGGQSLSM
jgi:SH3 domain-containing YSC84-like protein 1